MSARTSRELIVPPPVRPGARIAVVAPGSSVRVAAVREGIARLESWGYEVAEGRSLFARRGDLAGTDAARAADLEWALSDASIDAVWAARGGWGSARLLDRLDLRPVRRRPRWFVGFSDLTTLELRLLALGIASWHAPLVADLAMPHRFVEAELRRLLTAAPAPRRYAPGPRRSLVPGRAQGPIAGGSLTLIAGLAGTPWQPQLRGHVVFLEEVLEAPYRIDRLLWQLRASGLLDGIAGLVFGQFTACRPAQDRPSRPLTRILADFAKDVGVPALAGLPFGHGRKARAVPQGFASHLDATAGTLEILPPARRR